MALPTYTVLIDWAANEDFTDTGDDITTRVLNGPSGDVAIEYGRDNSRALAPLTSGTADIGSVDNSTGDYTPENSSSPLSGNLAPGRPVLIRATHLGTAYTLFQGHLDDYTQDVAEQVVSFSCLDGLARLRGAKISTQLFNGVRSGDAIGHVLDAYGWGSNRDIDPGGSIFPYWWEEDTDAFTAIERIVDSEGPPALATIGADGAFIFRDRHHRLTNTESLTAQTTMTDTGLTEPLIMHPVEYEKGWRDIVNSVIFNVDQRIPEGELSAVWRGSDTITIDDGQTIEIYAVASNPFIGAVTPVPTTGSGEDEIPGDYTIVSGTVTISLDRVTGASAVISVTATGGPAVITDLQLRAYAVSVARTVKIQVEDLASIGKHGIRSYPKDVPFANVHDALAVAQLVVNDRAEPLPVVTVTLAGAAVDDCLTQQLSRDLSDRVTIVDTRTSIDGDYYIERIRHRITEAGASLVTEFACEQAVDAELNADAFRFNTTGQGFNDGVFEGVGLVDPAMMFRFDTSGQGFDQGRLSY